jgi:zinc finger BED domain-containing protein 5/7/8/9
MDKFITRTGKGSSTTSTENMEAEPKRKKVTRQYDDSYLAFGFISIESADGPLPKCLLCCKTLSNANMLPSKLKRHLDSAHTQQSQKPLDYFKRLAQEFKHQSRTMLAVSTVPQQALEASFLVALHIAKAKKPHTIGEELLLPAAVDMCRLMIGESEANRLKSIPLSNDTIARRINAMAVDIQDQLLDRVKGSRIYALQLDETTDICKSAQLLVFIRYMWNGNVEEEMLFCKALLAHTTANVIFAELDSVISEDRGGWSLDWSNCIGVCTDGAPAMVGIKKGVVAQIKSKAPNVLATHCFIHREHLAAKEMSLHLNDVLQTCVKIVNSIKSSSLNSRLFSVLCSEMGSDHHQLLLHTEVRWLSRGRVLSRIYELRNEVKTFLEEHNMQSHSCFTSNEWIASLAYLSDIFEKVNLMNISLQGRDTNILNSTSKIEAFIRKLALWKTAVASGNYNFLDNLQDFIISSNHPMESMRDHIINHLSALENGFKRYFRAESIAQDFLWVQDPFSSRSFPSLSPHVQEMLIDLATDTSLKTEFYNVSLTQFWMRRKEEYRPLFDEAMKVLLPFASTYLCEGEV